MTRRGLPACLPVCVGGIVCYAVYISVLPFFFFFSLRDNVKNRLDGNALDEATAVTPGGAKKKAKSCLIHSSCLTRAVVAALKQGKNNKITSKMRCNTDRDCISLAYLLYTTFVL